MCGDIHIKNHVNCWKLLYISTDIRQSAAKLLIGEFKPFISIQSIKGPTTIENIA